MRKRTEIAIWSAVVVASLGLHAVAFGGLGGGRTDGFGKPKMKPTTVVDFSVPKPKDVPPPPPTPPKAAEKAPRLAMAHPARAKAVPPPSTPASAPPPADESPADFTGVTMTNDGPGAGWSSATGNGDAMKGPVGRPGARVTHRNVEGTGTELVRHPGPPIVAATDLSHPPVPPDLVEAVKQAYPADARTKGISGKAVIRLRIAPDGAASDLRIVSESAPSFGAACQSVLRGSRWSPPVDRQGQAVSTVVNFTCRFEVQ